ncbi:MAG: hypothetical protein PHC84_02065 [Clostridia bacterium]|nr:hypothetical protein [Clostridia bacterium]
METTKTQPAAATVSGDKQEKASYGKFNKLEDLLNAYNSLESEFTRRSQRLKEIESTAKAENRWEEKVQKLLEKYPVAAGFTEEISEEIAKEDVVGDENCLEKALLRVLCGKCKPVEEQAKDEKVINEVLKNDGLKEKIIDEYRQKLNVNLPKTFPKGGEIPVKAPARPGNIGDAGELALQMLKEI